MLPISSANGMGTHLTTALFTATTSVCVTGLVVVDTYAHWSFFGQLVILVLIQIGGLGVVAVGSMIVHSGREKISLAESKLLGDSLNVEKHAGIAPFLLRIFRGTFVVEGVGAFLYATQFVPAMGFWEGIWASIFQSVSAFCNAGMDVIGPNSMIPFRNSGFLMGVTMALIILGGLGFVVWSDVADVVREGIRKRFTPLRMVERLPEHSKLVLQMTAVLLLLGTLTVFVAEYKNPATLGNMSLSEKLLNSLFQSVTFRTAGFASLPQDQLTEFTCVFGCVLMFIGGSPVGTAGGVKTVTAFLFFMNALSYINGKKENVIYHRRVSEEMMRKAAAVIFVSGSAAFLMILLLMGTGDVPLLNAMYEVVSALGTVGLSRNLTPHLDTIGRFIIIFCMYLGRIGPISLMLFFAKKGGAENKLRHAEGTFYVG